MFYRYYAVGVLPYVPCDRRFLQNLLAMGIDALSNVTDRALTAAGVNEVLHGLIIDGILPESEVY